MDVLAHVTGKARAAKEATRALALASTRSKNDALQQMARGLEEKIGLVLDANRSDLARARSAGLASAFTDRLTLSESRIEEMAAGLRQVAAVSDADTSFGRPGHGLFPVLERGALGAHDNAGRELLDGRR